MLFYMVIAILFGESIWQGAKNKNSDWAFGLACAGCVFALFGGMILGCFNYQLPKNNYSVIDSITTGEDPDGLKSYIVPTSDGVLVLPDDEYLNVEVTGDEYKAYQQCGDTYDWLSAWNMTGCSYYITIPVGE